MMLKPDYRTPGIPDQQFIRGDIPMSKEEVRAVIISKLRLKADSIVYDIGAGTGSLAIEAARQVPDGQVFAVEKKAAAIELIKKNRDHFAVDNLQIIAGEAPAALAGLPPADRAFIGGSGGRLPAIMETITSKLNPQSLIVISAITLETLQQAVQEMEKHGREVDIVNVAVTRTRKTGNYRMFRALNPVYIISGKG